MSEDPEALCVPLGAIAAAVRAKRAETLEPMPPRPPGCAVTLGDKTKTATLAPVRAIREHCVHCVQSPYTVAECGGYRCALYPFRLGDAHAVSEEQREQLRQRKLTDAKTI